MTNEDNYDIQFDEDYKYRNHKRKPTTVNKESEVDRYWRERQTAKLWGDDVDEPQYDPWSGGWF